MSQGTVGHKFWVYSLPMLLLALPFVSILGLLQHWPESVQWDYFSWRYVGNILLFTLKQATLSAVLSISIGVCLALLLNHLQFTGKAWLLAYLNACFTLPVMVVVLLVLFNFGRYSWLQQWIEFKFYGLNAILIGHVFFNAPFAARIFYNQLQSTPENYQKIATQLQFSCWQYIRWVELRLLLPACLPVFISVFLLCFNSFALVLSLGGGPQATTLEVAIYQALKYQFDIPQTVVLASIQLLIGLLVAALMLLSPFRFAPLKSIRPNRYFRLSTKARRLHYLGLGGILLFWLWPMLYLFWRLLDVNWLLVLGHKALYQASITSVLLSIASASLTVLMVVLFIPLTLFKSRSMLTLLPMMTLVFAPMVLVVGLLVWLVQFQYPFWISIVIILLFNALMALPFAYQWLKPNLLQIKQQYQQTIASLQMPLVDQLRWVYLPLLLRPLMLIWIFSLVLALGDVGVILLLNNEHLLTLPLLIYQRLGNHQMDLALVTALLLTIMSIVAFYLQERLQHRLQR